MSRPPRIGPILAALGVVTVAAIGCHDYHIDFGNSTGEIGLFDDLYSVSVVDDQHAVAAGYYGATYWTADGGETWGKGQVDTISSLYNVSMADAEHGWAVGQRGLILRTVDGGRSWTRQPSLKEEEGTHLFSVHALDAKTAIAVGEWGTRIRTTDGGQTWEDRSFTIGEQHPMFVWLSPQDQEKVRNNEKVYDDVGLNDVWCRPAPSTRCWLIGEFGYIFYSTDGGLTWIQSGIEGSAEIEPVRFAYNELEVRDEEVAALGQFAGGVVGEAHLNVAIEGLASSAEIRAFGGADDPTELFEILEARTQEVRAVLEEAGVESERVRMRAQPPWDFEDYLEDDPDFLQRYLDGRLHEYPGVRVRVVQNPILFSVRFEDDEKGLIAGLGGVVLRSDNGGETWSYRKIDLKQALFSVGAVPGTAIAIGEKGLIRVSNDHGDNWRHASDGAFPTLFTYMRDIAFAPSGKMGLIVGQSGRVLRSTDFGQVWNQVLPPVVEVAESG